MNTISVQYYCQVLVAPKKNACDDNFVIIQHLNASGFLNCVRTVRRRHCPGSVTFRNFSRDTLSEHCGNCQSHR
ncbi:hypothetical protein CJO94_24120 (plasmid) [Ralstonia solanacearum]|nr:hypothetical protein CJO94_24120 [Ralstonia solanacearum]